MSHMSTLLRYLVDMGDGTTYTSPTIQHQYNEIGAYVITASVSNSLSTKTVTKQLDVQDKILKVRATI